MKLKWQPSAYLPGEWNLVDENHNHYVGYVRTQGQKYYVGCRGDAPPPPFPTLGEAQRYLEVIARMEGAS
jgi:hypothetical protein